MKTNEITWSYGLTVNLGDYSNVRSEVRVTIELEDGDDPVACEAHLRAQVKAMVQEEADAALEAVGKVAQFSAAPRYQILTTGDVWIRRTDGRQVSVMPPELVIIVLPNDMNLFDDASSLRWLRHTTHPARKMRLAHAMTVAEAFMREIAHETWRLIDCSDGDLRRVPVWVFEPPAAGRALEQQSLAVQYEEDEEEAARDLEAEILSANPDLDEAAAADLTDEIRATM